MDLTRLPVFPGWINRVLFRDSDPDLPRRWSALARCTHPCPTLLVHGQADRLVDPEHSRALHRERLRRGLPSRLIEEPELGHGWLHWAQTPASHRTGTQVSAFLAEGLDPA